MRQRVRNPKEVIGMKRTALLLFAAAVSALTVSSCREADAVTGREVMELIEDLEVGEPIRHKTIVIVPLYSQCIKDYRHYTTLDEAVDNGWLEITEVEGGQVPKVSMTNRSGRCVFIMGGEILTGCKQDRLVGRDVLLGPGSRNVVVPVYCVEQGRWTYESQTFYSKRNLGTPTLRAEGQKASGDAQANIWSDVGMTCDRAGARSRSSRFQEVYESEVAAPAIKRAERELGDLPRLYPDAIGAVIGVGNSIVSVDIFANPGLFGRLWPKILRSSALAAACDASGGSIDQQDAIRFLRRVHDKRYTVRPAIDIGHELSAADHEVNVNSLVYGDAVVHLAAFPEAKDTRDSGASRDSERRIRVMRR